MRARAGAVDGRRYYVFRKRGGAAEWPFHRPFHLILNLAVGGMMGGAIDERAFP